jgi:hypothetical protein
MFASQTDFIHVIKSSQPPIIEIPVIPISNRLSRTSILRQNVHVPAIRDSDQHHRTLIVPSPVVIRNKVPVGRARRTLTDDGSTDVVHHIGIISPPIASSYLEKRSSTQFRTTLNTNLTDDVQHTRISTASSTDFIKHDRTFIRKERATSNIIPLRNDELIDGPLTSSQEILYKDEDYDANLRQPVQVKITKSTCMS